MSTETTTAETAVKQKPTVLEGMTGYRTFDSVDEASAYLNKSSEDYRDFNEQTFAMVGVNPEDGTFDPAIYSADSRVRVSVLRNVPRTINGKKEPTVVKAIVVGAVPTLDSLLSDDAGRAWVQKIIDKELNHVLVRPLREADTSDSDALEAAISQMPKTRESFITSSREGAGILETFNELYKAINLTLSEKVNSWAKARLIKSDLKKAMESAAYALEYFPQLEDRGEGKDSLFVTAIKMGQAAAKRKGLDPAIFDKWLATRNEKAFTSKDEDEDLDIDALAESMEEEEAEPAPVEA